MSIESINEGDGQIEHRLGNINITDAIYNEYELMTYQTPGLRFNERGHLINHEENPIISMDNVDIFQHDEEGVKWGFDTSSLGIGINAGTIISGSRETTFIDKYKIRHNFVSEALCKENTDVSLRSVFQEEGDEDDELTPDFCWRDHNGLYHVVEITTTRNNTEEGLERMYNFKAFKYRYALETRALKDIVISYSIIVVSSDFVLSSVKLPRVLVSELIVRMRIGLALENLARSLGLTLETDEPEVLHKAFYTEIHNHLQKIGYKEVHKRGTLVDKDYIQSIKENVEEKEIVKIYLNQIKECKEESLNMKYDDTFHSSKIKNYIDKCKQGDRRSVMKPIINLPLILPKSTKSSVDIPDKILEHNYKNVETKLWSIAFDNYRSERSRNIDEDPSNLLNEALETNKERIKEYETSRKSQRSKYHRVNIISDLSSMEKETLAEQGLWAKRCKKDNFYQNRRKYTQLPFHYDTNTSDIDNFLNGSQSLFDSVEESYEPDDLMFPLIEKANEMINNTSKGVEVTKNWCKTKIMRSLQFLSDIAMELCVANKQNCKTGHAILKKIRYFDAYILIFPTKSSEHMFFTIYTEDAEILTELPFRNIIKFDGSLITSIVSVKQSKLENWVTIASTFLTLTAFWSWFYEFETDEPNNFVENHEARKMLLLTLLIRLEDKAQTEESVTLVRYMYMENFKGLVTPKMADPFKVLEKFTTFPRSRLNLWVIKNIIEKFTTMVEHPPSRFDIKAGELIEGEDALPRDTWMNLLNCFTGGSVQSASKLINLMYLGYFKNKNESPEGNTDFLLIEKTLEEEFKLDRDNMEYSRGEVPSNEFPRGKQFNKKCIMYGCQLMEKKMKRVLGQNWKEFLGREILDKLASATTDTIASLKASSTVEHESAPSQSSYLDPKASMRCKVIEALSKKLEKFRLNPFTHLLEFIIYIENSSKGIIADLFKKQQHGGLREIYVLTIESRIVQLFLETISRTICSYFDEETLTHPKNKLKKLNEHRKLSTRLSQKRGSLVVDLCSSNDKTRWNQNFVMTAMVIPLIRFTPDYMHNSIIRIINLWSNKLIRIPQSVCIQLLNRTKFMSDTYNKMLDLFWSPNINIPIFDFQAANCIRLETGMMQGILHYLSSLLHLTFIYCSNTIVLLLLHSWYPTFKFLMTQICSSDDSACILSVLSPTDALQLDAEFIKVACHASLCLESLSRTCRYFCMIESSKSSISLIDSVEFNSEFMFNNTVAMPVIKFVAASLNLTESESFMERFYNMYNLISDLFASGFSAEHTHICQIAQCLLHYKTMGSSINPLFYLFSELISQWPDPKYGFFLIDTQLMPGVLGFSYTHWNACIKTPIFQGSSKEISCDPWITTPEGGIIQSLIMKHGEVIRWKKLVDNVKGDLIIKDEIDKDPSLLFRNPENVFELKLKFSINATSPGVAKSMRRGNPFMQAIAMSVYAINTHSFSKTSVVSELNVRSKVTEKVCILGELDRKIRQEHELSFDRDFKTSLLVAFPNLTKYEDISNLLSQLKDSMLVPCHRFRERKNEVVIQPRSSILPLSLLQVVKTRWFGFPIRASHKIYKKCLDVYKQTIPWLKDTIQETLLECPFETYQELYHFICSSLEKTRIFRRNGPGIHSKRLIGQLYNMIRKSQRPCHVLIDKGKGKKIYPSQDLITKINLALSIPEKVFREGHVKTLLKSSSPIYDDLSSMLTMTKRDATLGYLQGIVKEDFSKDEVALHIREQGVGTHVSYVQEQRKVVSDKEVKWIGEGSCYVFVDGCQIHLSFKDDFLKKIEIDNWKILRSNMYNFNQLIREMKLRPILDSGKHARLLARYNGTHFITQMGVGCPVYLLPETRKIIFDPAELVVRIDHNEIKLNQKVKSRDSRTTLYEITMLKYRMNHNEIIVSPKSPIIEKDMWTSWINQRCCSVDTLFIKIRRALKDKKSKLFSWLQETLQCRLKYKNIGSFSINYYDTALEYQEVKTDSKEDEAHDEELLNMIKGGKLGEVEESVMKLFSQKEELEKLSKMDPESWIDIAEQEEAEIQRQANEILIGLGLHDPLPLWIEYVKNWREVVGEESVSILGPTYGSFLSVHPMWDEFIDGFLSEKETFWLEMCDGKIPHGYEDVSKDLMELLGVKVRGITSKQVGMSDRYKKALEMEQKITASKDVQLEEYLEPLDVFGEEIAMGVIQERDEDIGQEERSATPDVSGDINDIYSLFD